MKFARPEEAQRVREQSLAAQARLAGLKSLADFPLAAVQSVAWVEAGQEIVRVFPATAGEPGLDVYKAVIPGAKGPGPELHLFEGLKLQKDAVTAAVKGLLERGAAGSMVLLRVRPHRNAELQVTVSEDRMQARVSFFPAEGTGRSFGAEELKSRLGQGGVLKGLEPGALRGAGQGCDGGQGPQGPADRPGPAAQAGAGPSGHLSRASGLRGQRDGERGRQGGFPQPGQAHLRAPRRADRHPLPAGPRGRGRLGRDRQDRARAQGKAGVPVRRQGRARLPAAGRPRAVLRGRRRGAVLRGHLLEVKRVHVIDGDIGLERGNVKFSGVVQIRGSVLSGFHVEAGDDVIVEQTVQAAVVSSEGAITIRQGIKGEGKARLSAARFISALFAEQAAIRAGGDVRIRNACVRCQVRCNGRLTLETEKGNLIGGKAQARQGLAVQNLGSPSGTHTEVSFGQDYLLLEKIEQTQTEAAHLAARLVELKAARAPAGEAGLRPQGAGAGRGRAQGGPGAGGEERPGSGRAAGAISRRDFPAEVVVRGVLYPGVVLESHGRTYSPTVEKHLITLRYDPKDRQIVEKPV